MSSLEIIYTVDRSAMQASLHSSSHKTYHFYFYDNCSKCGLILIILSLQHSEMNSILP